MFIENRIKSNEQLIEKNYFKDQNGLSRLEAEKQLFKRTKAKKTAILPRWKHSGKNKETTIIERISSKLIEENEQR